MGKYIPQLGDVIMDNGIPMVVVTIKNHECIGDCSYDREYFICEEEYICKCGCLSCMDEMKQHGRWIRIQGVEFPNIEQELSLDEVKSLLEKNNILYSSIQKEKNKRHVFTHLIWNMSCYRIEVKKKFSSSFRKISTLASYPLPTAFLSYRTLLDKENDR